MKLDEINYDTHPRLLSLEFHLSFFPKLLLRRTALETQRESGFNSTMEMYVLFAVCIILILIGIPSAVTKDSVIGWVIGCIGSAGIMALLINSIVWGIKSKPTYSAFLSGIFYFFPVLGLSAGVFTGTLDHSLIEGILMGGAGLIAGYLLGIIAGLWLQYLGWMANILNMLAFLAVFGMVFVDIVLIGGTMF